MNYVLIKNGVVDIYPYSIAQFRVENPLVSLPLDPSEDQLSEVGLYIVTEAKIPLYDLMTQKLSHGPLEFIEGSWKETWVVVDMTPEEIQQNNESKKAKVKAQATSLLVESDWAELPSVTNPEITPHLTNANEWVAYRAALRGIAVNPPVEVAEWPTKPEEVWS